MKKIIVLAIAMAIVAGAAFASTDPAISGSFQYKLTFDFNSDGAAASTDDEVKFAINGVVDDFTTVSVKINDMNGDDGLDSGGTGIPLELDDFTMTQDITGALGLEAPITLSATYGWQDMGPAEYSDDAVSHDKVELGAATGKYGAIKLAIGIMDMVTLKTIITPTEYGTGVVPFAIEADITAIDGLKFNVYFTKDDSATVNQIGFTADYVISIVELCLGMDYNLDAETAPFQFGAKATVIEGLTVSAVFAASDLMDLANTGYAGAKLAYVITDNLDVYAAGLYDFGASAFGYDFGLNAKLGAVTYNVGYSDSDMLYMLVKASF